MGFLGGSVVKNPSASAGMRVQSLGQDDALEKEIATHSSILFWEMYVSEWKSFSYVWLFWEPMVSTVHGILQVRILEWVAFPFSRGSSQPRDWTHISYIVGGYFLSFLKFYLFFISVIFACAFFTAELPGNPEILLSPPWRMKSCHLHNMQQTWRIFC